MKKASSSAGNATIREPSRWPWQAKESYQIKKLTTAALLATVVALTPWLSSRPASASATAIELAPVSEPGGTVASLNWSGYALEGNFSLATGTFTVPSDQGPGMAGEWVGIDGFDDQDLIQAGVMESDGAAWAWWEILPSLSVRIPWFRASPGDRVEVTIKRADNAWRAGSSWVVDMLNEATLQFFRQEFQYNGPGSSAEWVVETPAALDTADGILPYGYTAFTGIGYDGRVAALHALWLVQDGKVDSLPSEVDSARQLVQQGFGAEYVG